MVAALLVAAGCTCGESTLAPPYQPSSDPEPPPFHEDGWPTAEVADLPPATPATEIVARPGRIEISNHALVATWPTPALERARADAPAGADDWPRLSVELDDPSADGRAIPALTGALELARRAERSATGAGSGAGVYNLRIERSVPFEQVERIVYTAGLAGYDAARILLSAEDGDRMLAWPSARNADAPSPEAIEAALAAAAEPTEPSPADAPSEREVPRQARLVVSDERIAAYLGDTLQGPGCAADAGDDQELTLTGDASADAIGRCVDRLHERASDGPLTIAMAPDLPFERVAAILQRGVRAFDGSVRVVGQP